LIVSAIEIFDQLIKRVGDWSIFTLAANNSQPVRRFIMTPAEIPHVELQRIAVRPDT